MCATSIGSTFSHSPVPGERKSGIPDGTEIPAPVSATTVPAERISSASAAAAHLPLNSGVRLPRNAPMPSRASSEANAFANASFSAAMPSSRSPLWDACLISSSASGAWRANLRAHWTAVSNSSWSCDDAVDEPVLVAVLGRDRLARGVHLERLGRPHEPRQPLRAAEAGDDAEVDLGLAEGGREAREADVAGHRQLAAAAEREAVDRGDRHRPRPLPRAQQVVRAVEQLAARGLVHLRERLDVGARAEQRRVRRGEDHRLDRRVGLDRLPRLAELGDHVGRDRVRRARCRATRSRTRRGCRA